MQIVFICCLQYYFSLLLRPKYLVSELRDYAFEEQTSQNFKLNAKCQGKKNTWVGRKKFLKCL